jgi:hypothetical protein
MRFRRSADTATKYLQIEKLFDMEFALAYRASAFLVVLFRKTFKNAQLYHCHYLSQLKNVFWSQV